MNKISVNLMRIVYFEIFNNTVLPTDLANLRSDADAVYDCLLRSF